MSRYYEFEGKNINAAVRNACDTLKILKENLKYEIVQQGSGGIFGLFGKKVAKIRVMRIQNETTSDESIAPELKPVASSAAPSLKTTQLDEKDAAITADNDDAGPANKEISDPLELALNALRRILDCITSDTEINVDKKRDPIELMISGPYPGIIIGKHGQTLEAIQYLVEKMVSRKCKKHIRLHIDVENYLKKRRDNLIQLALRLAEKAVISGKPVTIGVMNSQERRTVHIALREKKGVRTQSVGSGIMRKLIIFPKKNNRRAK